MAIELDNSFTVPVPPEQAWDVLLDVETIAPCMPGASVTSVDGDEIQGQVKVKLGPLSLSYKGTAKFTEKDQATHTFSIEATGKETRGAGTASATVQASLKPADGADETLVSIHTSLNVTGRPAQFGRSLLPEVSGKLIAQFATNLQAMINADGAATTETSASETSAAETTATETAPAGTEGAEAEAAETAPAGTEAAETAATQAGEASAAAEPAPVATKPTAPVIKQEESLNAFKFVVIPILKRLIPVAAVGAALAIAVRRLRGKKS
jgi:carbon monoxide dehydrogenase subunit G